MPVLANGVMQRLQSAGAVSDLTSALIGGHDWGLRRGASYVGPRCTREQKASGRSADV
jgi:hypothetical protein